MIILLIITSKIHIYVSKLSIISEALFTILNSQKWRWTRFPMDLFINSRPTMTFEFSSFKNRPTYILSFYFQNISIKPGSCFFLQGLLSNKPMQTHAAPPPPGGGGGNLHVHIGDVQKKKISPKFPIQSIPKFNFQAVPSPPTAGLLRPAPWSYSRPKCNQICVLQVCSIRRPETTNSSSSPLQSPTFSLRRGTYLLKWGPSAPPGILQSKFDMIFNKK